MTVFIQKGDKPMSYRQAVKRGLRHFESEKLAYEREQGIVENDQTYLEWANQWIADNEINALNNLFNKQLDDYRKALKRLEQYIVSEGREEVTEDFATGQFDDNGEEIIETVITQTKIDPLEEMVEVKLYNEETLEETTELVRNPLIVKDEEERSAAQAVIDSTPQDVKDFDQ